MSTRAMYTFIEPEHKDNKRGYHVYKHHDGYPSGAAQHIERALPHAWKGGRFEADEFAAAFVAGNKSPYIRDELELLRQIVDGPVIGDTVLERLAATEALHEHLKRVRDYARNSGGGVRLMHSGSVYAVAPSDIEYRYEITPAPKGTLWVRCYSTDFGKVRSAKHEKLEFEGTLEAFKAWALAGEDA